MQTLPWRGIFPAVTTKFHADASLDFAGKARHIDLQIRNGIHGVVCCVRRPRLPVVGAERERIEVLVKTALATRPTDCLSQP